MCKMCIDPLQDWDEPVMCMGTTTTQRKSATYRGSSADSELFRRSTEAERNRRTQEKEKTDED